MNGTKRLAGKVGFALCTALLATLTGHATYAAEVSVGVTIHSESDFYEPLTPQGEWVVVGSYGRCWRPHGVEVGWRPYCNGSWQRTDAGWYWVSDEPWGWATYHYGRWDMDAEFGWFWVPQTVWAPAWVSWHEGGGYIGWAPLSPSGRVEVNIISPRVVFVEERRFLEPIRPTTVIVNNTTIINKTVINKGPDTVIIEKASGRKIQAAPVRELRTKEEAKVAVKHPTPTSTTEKAAPTPVRNQAEPAEKKVVPAQEPHRAEKPATTTAEPQPPVTKKEVHPADKPIPVAKPAEENRVRPEKASETGSEKAKAPPAGPEAKPATKPETKHETKPDGKVESKPATDRPAATKEPTEQKPGKDDEKKD